MVLRLSINMLLIKEGIRRLGTVSGHLRIASGIWECHLGLEVGFMGLGKVSWNWSCQGHGVVSES